MKHPQILNIKSSDNLRDRQIAIDGNDVIRDDNQELMSVTETTITIDIEIYDLTVGSPIATVASKVMTYQADADIWTIEVSDLMSALGTLERHKFIARVRESGGSPVMRSFKLQEFVIDSDAFENVLIRLPYQVVIGTPSKIIWYEDTTWLVALYQAEVYQGGVGTTSATDPSRVTHRGPIVAV